MKIEMENMAVTFKIENVIR